MKYKLISVIMYFILLAFAGCQTDYRKGEQSKPVPVNDKFNSFVRENFDFDYRRLCPDKPCVFDTVGLKQTYFAPLKLKLYRFVLLDPEDRFSIIEYTPENKYYVNSLHFEADFYRHREYVASKQGCTSYARKFNEGGDGFGVEDCLNEFYKDTIISAEVFEEFVNVYTLFEITSSGADYRPQPLKVESEKQLYDFINRNLGEDKTKNQIFKSEIQKVIKHLHKPYFHVFIIYDMYVKVIELTHANDFNSRSSVRNVQRFNLYKYTSYMIPIPAFIYIGQE